MSRYLVYWTDMLKNGGGDAPMRAFDTTIEANAYINGCTDTISTFTKGVENTDLLQEFYVQDITEPIKSTQESASIENVAYLGED